MILEEPRTLHPPVRHIDVSVQSAFDHNTETAQSEFTVIRIAYQSPGTQQAHPRARRTRSDERATPATIMHFAPATVYPTVDHPFPSPLRARISSFFLWVALLQRHEQSRASGAPLDRPPSTLNPPLCHQAAYFRRR